MKWGITMANEIQYWRWATPMHPAPLDIQINARPAITLRLDSGIESSAGDLETQMGRVLMGTMGISRRFRFRYIAFRVHRPTDRVRAMDLVGLDGTTLEDLADFNEYAVADPMRHRPADEHDWAPHPTFSDPNGGEMSEGDREFLAERFGDGYGDIHWTYSAKVCTRRGCGCVALEREGLVGIGDITHGVAYFHRDPLKFYATHWLDDLFETGQSERLPCAWERREMERPHECQYGPSTHPKIRRCKICGKLGTLDGRGVWT